MTGFNHGMTGAVLALTIKQPAIAVPVAFLSHFAQDLVPHWDYGTSVEQSRAGESFNRRFNLTLLADFLFSVFLMLLLAVLFPAQKWIIWACMIAAASPDLVWAYYRLYVGHIRKQRPLYDPVAKFHMLIQWSQTSKGFIVEVGWFIIFGIIILNLR